MASKNENVDPVPLRRDRLLRERVHDTYKSKRKLPEPTICPRCSAVYHKGRWQWGSRPAKAHEHVCPACHRMADNYPAGYVSLKGRFLAPRTAEIVHLARNVESRESSEHPMERIIDVEKREDGILITTTAPHLARGIGEALHHALGGSLSFHHVEESNVLRVSWSRD